MRVMLIQARSSHSLVADTMYGGIEDSGFAALYRKPNVTSKESCSYKYNRGMGQISPLGSGKPMSSLY